MEMEDKTDLEYLEEYEEIVLPHCILKIEKNEDEGSSSSNGPSAREPSNSDNKEIEKNEGEGSSSFNADQGSVENKSKLGTETVNLSSKDTQSQLNLRNVNYNSENTKLPLLVLRNPSSCAQHSKNDYGNSEYLKKKIELKQKQCREAIASFFETNRFFKINEKVGNIANNSGVSIKKKDVSSHEIELLDSEKNNCQETDKLIKMSQKDNIKFDQNAGSQSHKQICTNLDNSNSFKVQVQCPMKEVQMQVLYPAIINNSVLTYIKTPTLVDNINRKMDKGIEFSNIEKTKIHNKDYDNNLIKFNNIRKSIEKSKIEIDFKKIKANNLFLKHNLRGGKKSAIIAENFNENIMNKNKKSITLNAQLKSKSVLKAKLKPEKEVKLKLKPGTKREIEVLALEAKAAKASKCSIIATTESFNENIINKNKKSITSNTKLKSKSLLKTKLKPEKEVELNLRPRRKRKSEVLILQAEAAQASNRISPLPANIKPLKVLIQKMNFKEYFENQKDTNVEKGKCNNEMNIVNNKQYDTNLRPTLNVSLVSKPKVFIVPPKEKNGIEDGLLPIRKLNEFIKSPMLHEFCNSSTSNEKADASTQKIVPLLSQSQWNNFTENSTNLPQNSNNNLNGISYPEVIVVKNKYITQEKSLDTQVSQLPCNSTFPIEKQINKIFYEMFELIDNERLRNSNYKKIELQKKRLAFTKNISFSNRESATEILNIVKNYFDKVKPSLKNKPKKQVAKIHVKLIDKNFKNKVTREQQRKGHNSPKGSAPALSLKKYKKTHQSASNLVVPMVQNNFEDEAESILPDFIPIPIKAEIED